jgi:alpha-ketoglutarate-dependent taurine dioxygenase
MTQVCSLGALGPGGLSAIAPELILENLWQPGVVLVRDVGPDLSQFEAFTYQFCDRFHRSAARDELRELSGDGYSVRTPGANFTLLAHNEGSYRPFEPADLAFFLCLEAPGLAGGETLLVDGRAFLRRLPSKLRNRFETEGVIFEANWEEKRWQAELGVENTSELRQLEGIYPDFSSRIDNEIMRYRCRRQAIVKDTQGELAFANAILAHLPRVLHPAYKNANAYANESNQVFFGNGQPLTREEVDTLIDIQDSVAFEHPPATGDLLVIDNSRVMHGRRSTQGDCSRVLLTRFGYLRGDLMPCGP